LVEVGVIVLTMSDGLPGTACPSAVRAVTWALARGEAAKADVTRVSARVDARGRRGRRGRGEAADVVLIGVVEVREKFMGGP